MNYGDNGTWNDLLGGSEKNDFYGIIERRQATSIPTLSEWGMIILVVLLSGSAIWFVRRRTTTV